MYRTRTTVGSCLFIKWQGDNFIRNDNSFDSLDISPEEGNFSLPHHFYSSLKEDVMTRKEYENVKNFIGQ